MELSIVGDVLNENEIINHCLENLAGTVLVESWGEKGIFYNPDGLLKRGVYIATLKSKNGDNDSASNLDREGTFRLNIGVRKSTFIRLFGEVPTRPAAGGVVSLPVDFTEIDKILPHPVYAWMGWICILNPSQESFKELKIFLQEAYEYSKEKYGKKKLK
jgi:hypothetical protein